MDTYCLERSIRFYESFATSHNLVFQTVENTNDENYLTYIKAEFDFKCIFDDFPIVMEPESFTVTIDNVKLEFYFQTFLYGQEYYPFKLIIYAESHSNIETLLEYLEEKYNKNKCKMYCWSVDRNQYKNSDYMVSYQSRQNLVGLDVFFDSMKKEIQAIKEHKELALLLGASSGANYFTYGPPGTGKTSSFKVLGHELNVPVYSVNLSLVPQNHYKHALSPKSDADIIIVIVEDFDRYIKNEKMLSELLNSLDGVHYSMNVIRIFTSNMPEMALQDRALRSRMKRFIKFDLPTSENIYQHLLNVSKQDEIHARVLTDMIFDSNLHISYRELNHFLSRFITNTNLLESAINGFGEWITDTDIVNKLEKLL